MLHTQMQLAGSEVCNMQVAGGFPPLPLRRLSVWSVGLGLLVPEDSRAQSMLVSVCHWD